MLSWFRRRETFEQRIAVLAECGIALRPDIRPESLLGEDPKEARRSRRWFERKGAQGYGALLSEMGTPVWDAAPHGRGRPPSDDVWCLDTECIENPGDYMWLVERFCTLSRGDLAYDRIEDRIDFDEEVAWVELTRDGKTRRIDVELNDDWVDVMLLEAMYEELAATGSRRRFRLVSEGSDLTDVCLTPEEADTLARRTGLTVGGD